MNEDLKYALNSLWKATSVSGEDQLTMGIFNNTTSLTLWKKGNNRPALKFNIPAHVRVKLSSMVTEVMKAGPDTRVSIVRSEYDKETKTYTPDVTLVLGKDDKNLMYIEIGSKAVEPVRFMFRLAGTYSFNGTSGAMDKLSLSMLAAQTFKDILENQVATGELLSTFNTKPAGSKYGNKSSGSGSSYNKSSSSSSYGGDDDIPF